MAANHGHPGEVSNGTGVTFHETLHKQQRDAELTEELESHLQLHMEDNLRAGMTPEAARCDALLKLAASSRPSKSIASREGYP